MADLRESFGSESGDSLTAETVTELPPWADADLSRDLSDLVSTGERQHMEFKEALPAQIRDFAKEIAAFATSNPGVILLGIADTCDVVGLKNCNTPTDRAQLIQRIEGLCAGTVKPAITAAFRFGVVDGRVVLAIDVPKGSAPVYYVNNVPYLRKITSSRPAEPHEVIDLILAWHRTHNQDAKQSPESSFLSEVASLVVDVLVHGGELELRQVDPWLGCLRSDLALFARQARELAIQAPTALSDIAVPLEELATELDNVAHERLTMNSGWEEMRSAAEAAMGLALKIKQGWIDSNRIDERSVSGLRESVESTRRRLASLASRLKELTNQNRLDDIQAEAADHGLTLLKAATIGVGLGDEGSLAELTAIGRLLRDIEMRRIYADGNQSLNRILDDVGQASGRLNQWLLKS